MGVTPKAYRISFQGDKSVQKLIVVGATQLCENVELYLKCVRVWYVNYTQRCYQKITSDSKY